MLMFFLYHVFLLGEALLELVYLDVLRGYVIDGLIDLKVAHR